MNVMKWITKMECAVCGSELPTTPGAGRPRRYCSVGCRQRAYRRRNHAEGDAGPRARSPRDGRPGVAVVVLLVWPDRGEAAEVAEAVSVLDLPALISRLGDRIDAMAAAVNDTGDVEHRARESPDSDDSGWAAGDG
jgi:hypothetical protein